MIIIVYIFNLQWRLIVVETEDRAEVSYGKDSQMRVIQEERQKVAMAAFCLPNE